MAATVRLGNWARADPAGEASFLGGAISVMAAIGRHGQRLQAKRA
ncbi:MAG: hypothetical protein ACLS7Z_06905 [Christensenellales bacterium]